MRLVAGPAQLMSAVSIGAAAIIAMPAPAIASVPQFRESFGGGAVGSKPTSANTHYDQTIGDRGDGTGNVHVTFASDGYRGHGAKFSVDRTRESVFGFLGERIGPQHVVYLRRYYKISALPRYRTSVLLYKFGGDGNGQLGGTHNGSMAIGGSAQKHKFVLVNNNANVARSTADVPVGSWFRVEVKLDLSKRASTQTVRLFLGRNRDGRSPDETVHARLTGTHTGYLEDGVLTNPARPLAVRIDEVADGNTWIGPS